MLTVLVITPDGVHFREAKDLKGRDTFETENVVKKRFRQSQKGWNRPDTTQESLKAWAWVRSFRSGSVSSPRDLLQTGTFRHDRLARKFLDY